ncbi:MAG: DUF4369 domain-containing protein [Flavobacteriaceae bacterium]
MKKILFLAVVTLFVSCTKEEGNLFISGEIQGLSQGKLYIQRWEDSLLKPIKIIKFDRKSDFETYLNIEEPEVLSLYLDRGTTQSLDDKILFFAEKGKMKITSDIDNFIAKAQITGNENQELWSQYKEVIRKMNHKNLEYVEQQLQAAKEGRMAAADSLQGLQEHIFRRKYQYTIQFCMTHPDKELSPYLALTEIHDANRVYLDSIYGSLSESVKQSKYGKIFGEYLKEPTQ